jgi:hypothetical protein
MHSEQWDWEVANGQLQVSRNLPAEKKRSLKTFATKLCRPQKNKKPCPARNQSHILVNISGGKDKNASRMVWITEVKSISSPISTL